jgi:hypothetical protein
VAAEALACWKIAYATREEAFLARQGVKRRAGHKGLSVYVCPECGSWHLGRWRGRPPTRKVRL